MIGLSGEIPLVSHSDVTSPFPPSGNGGYASNRDVFKLKKRPKSIMNYILYFENNIFYLIAFYEIVLIYFNWYKCTLEAYFTLLKSIYTDHTHTHIGVYIQVHLINSECSGKVHLFQ